MAEPAELRALAALVDTRDDEDTLRAASVDSGRILARKPRALAAPRSARDVVEIVRWANRIGSPVALRGRGHTQGGQSLTSGGVQIDMQGLDRIGPVDEERQTLRVQAGATWREVVGHARRRGWMPMVLTNIWTPRWAARSRRLVSGSPRTSTARRPTTSTNWRR